MGEKTPQIEKPLPDAMSIVAEKAPVTSRRKVLQDLDAKLPKPCAYKFMSSFPLFINSVVIDSKTNITCVFEFECYFTRNYFIRFSYIQSFSGISK